MAEGEGLAFTKLSARVGCQCDNPCGDVYEAAERNGICEQFLGDRRDGLLQRRKGRVWRVDVLWYGGDKIVGEQVVYGLEQM